MEVLIRCFYRLKTATSCFQGGHLLLKYYILNFGATTSLNDLFLKSCYLHQVGLVIFDTFQRLIIKFSVFYVLILICVTVLLLDYQIMIGNKQIIKRF
ncbi:hypothetical protein HanPI659440_Chr03g0101751 [Helianthus annuus]|nr:hypothetical protein HanPI659440_Chr03g0101751 [Helianthus annuus]